MNTFPLRLNIPIPVLNDVTITSRYVIPFALSYTFDTGA